MCLFAVRKKLMSHSKGRLKTDVLERKGQRRIFGRKREEVKGRRRKMHSDELHNLYSSSSIIRVKKSRRMKWARHKACMGEINIRTNI
jgi:hypothetical protein